MNRYLARFVACLILAGAFSLLTLTLPRVGKNKIEVRTDGPTADVVAAVEGLSRDDLTVKVAPDGFVTNPVGSAIAGAVALAVALWLAVGCVKRLEAWIGKNRVGEPKA